MRLRKLLLIMMAFLLLIGNEGPISVFAEGDNDHTLRAAEGTNSNTPPEELTESGPFEPPGKDLEANESPALPEGQSVTDSVYRALLAVEKTELVINPGESVRFINDTSKTINISTDAKSTNGIRYDCVSYDDDGDVSYNDMIRINGVVPVNSKGGTAVITVD